MFWHSKFMNFLAEEVRKKSLTWHVKLIPTFSNTLWQIFSGLSLTWQREMRKTSFLSFVCYFLVQFSCEYSQRKWNKEKSKCIGMEISNLCLGLVDEFYWILKHFFFWGKFNGCQKFEFFKMTFWAWSLVLSYFHMPIN